MDDAHRFARNRAHAEVIVVNDAGLDIEVFDDARHASSLHVRNPLGARALYIFQNNQDTLYRPHGTPEWRSIGKAVSSGCVRLVNQDVIDLYRRVPHHAPIVVHQTPLAV
jgi:hypothetical protein